MVVHGRGGGWNAYPDVGGDVHDLGEGVQGNSGGGINASDGVCLEAACGCGGEGGVVSDGAREKQTGWELDLLGGRSPMESEAEAEDN